MKLRVILALWTLAAALFTTSAGAVILDDTARVELSLADGTTLLLFGKYTGSSGRRPTEFYYLPANLKLASYPDGTPQFLFLKFTGDDTASAQGALMHFLMTWGLSDADRNRLQTRLRKQYPNARIAGPVPLEIDEGGSFTIVSGTIGQEQFIHSGRAPVVAGSRVAAAAKMDSTQAQLMDKTLKDMAIGDVSVSAFYTYKTLSPGVRAKIDIDWSSFHSRIRTLEAEYAKSKGRGGLLGKSWSWTVGEKKEKRSYTEMREDLEFLREQGIIKIEIEQYQDNEITKAVTDAVMQYFLNASSQLAEPDAEMPPPAAEEEESDPNIRRGHRYVYKESFLKQINERKSQTMALNGRVPIRYPVTITGNIRDWYHSVKDNRRNVDTVNLSDPFFQIRPINFILDLEANDIFTDAINFVTINVRKKRNGGHDFEDSMTIDRKYFEENGVRVSSSYARGDDKNSNVFEYQTVWSVRGGGKFPSNPVWERGDWESVNLEPPVRGRTIDIEADLGEIRAADISRATVQIRYPRLGKELQTNVALSPGEGISLKSERIITDVDAKGYVYRVVLNHKSEGRLVLPWSAKVGDDYVYVDIPDELENTEAPVFVEARQAGEQFVQNVEEKILERFDELLD